MNFFHWGIAVTASLLLYVLRVHWNACVNGQSLVCSWRKIWGWREEVDELWPWNRIPCYLSPPPGWTCWGDCLWVVRCALCPDSAWRIPRTPLFLVSFSVTFSHQIRRYLGIDWYSWSLLVLLVCVPLPWSWWDLVSVSRCSQTFSFSLISVRLNQLEFRALFTHSLPRVCPDCVVCTIGQGWREVLGTVAVTPSFSLTPKAVPPWPWVLITLKMETLYLWCLLVF